MQRECLCFPSSTQEDSLSGYLPPISRSVSGRVSAGNGVQKHENIINFFAERKYTELKIYIHYIHTALYFYLCNIFPLILREGLRRFLLHWAYVFFRAKHSTVTSRQSSFRMHSQKPPPFFMHGEFCSRQNKTDRRNPHRNNKQ